MKLTLQDMMKILKELLKGRFKITFPKFTIFSFHIFEHWSKRCWLQDLRFPVSLFFLDHLFPYVSCVCPGWFLTSFPVVCPQCGEGVLAGLFCEFGLPSDLTFHRPLALTHSWAGQNPSWFQLLFLVWPAMLSRACLSTLLGPFSSSLWNATLLPWLLLAWSLFPGGFCGISGWSPPFRVLWSVRIFYFVVSGVHGTLVLLSSGTICTQGDSGIF